MLEILNLIRLILYLRHVDWQVVVDWRFEVCSSVMLTNSLQKFQKSVSVIWLHINKLAVICIFGWQLSANAPQTVDNKWSTSMCYTANKCNSYLNTLNVGGSYLHFWPTVLHHRQLTTNDQLIRGTQPLWEESYFFVIFDWMSLTIWSFRVLRFSLVHRRLSPRITESPNSSLMALST